MCLEDRDIVTQIKKLFAPDGGAEREHNAAPGTLGFGLIHYALVTNLKPENALVIGSRYGFIPGIISLALKMNGRGKLDFVDANYDDVLDGFGVAFGGIGYWKSNNEWLTALGLQDVMEIHLMRSEDFFRKCKKSYDYIYLDGDHSYHGCRFDLEKTMRIASPTALIALHDVLVREEPFGVDKVFSEVDKTIYNTLLIPAWPGLGIIQRKKEI